VKLITYLRPELRLRKNGAMHPHHSSSLLRGEEIILMYALVSSILFWGTFLKVWCLKFEIYGHLGSDTLYLGRLLLYKL
jgi:hypothetical protein